MIRASVLLRILAIVIAITLPLRCSHAEPIAQLNHQGTRIVLDTKGPVRVDKAFTLAAADDQPARLVIDLSPTDRESFLRGMTMENRSLHTVGKTSVSPQPMADADARPLIGAVVHSDKETLIGGRHAAEIRGLLEDRGVVVFPRVDFSDEEQIAFTQQAFRPWLP